MIVKARSARNPARRNRNIGTPKSGHGQNNRLTIPDGNQVFFQRLGPHTVVELRPQGRSIRLIVENPRRGVFHSCTPDDLQRVLSLIPIDDWTGIESIVLRQPKRKEEVLQPVWGRLSFNFEYQSQAGAAILLEAVDCTKPMRWSRHLDPDDQQEFARLRADGFAITEGKRDYQLRPSLESVRSVQLFRTLLHEVGHWVDYKDRGDDLYWRDSTERETFAHRYANNLFKKLHSEGLIPFDRMWSGSWPSLNPEHFRLTQPVSRP